MQLALQGVIPIPLKDKIINRKSDIWNCSQLFTLGEYIFIQAPSGSGKTTLIHILYGLRTDFIGSVLWNSNSLSSIDAESLSVLRTNNLSVIFQDLRLFPELTAIENIEIKRQLTNTVSDDRILEWMDRLGVKHKANSLGKTLSYGEQQRIAIIRALSQPFNWLLMDEPFSHLDKANTLKAKELILEVVKQNNASLILADLDENNYFPYTKTIIL